MTISERIFERLEKLHMTQREFSDRTGIKPSTISEWKKNKTNPSSESNLGACHNEQSVNICSRWLTGIFFESIIHIIENRNDI